MLDLSGCELSASDALDVAELLKGSNSLTSLNLSSNELCGVSINKQSLKWEGTYTADGITAISGALKGNTSLTTLVLSSNQLCGIYGDGDGEYDATGIKAITDALCINNSLTSVDVGWNNIGKENALELITIFKQKEMVSVGLASCELGLEGAADVADYVRGSVSLTSCDVRDSDISGNAASQLSAPVLGNTNIEKFNEIPIKEMRADSLSTLNLHLPCKNIGVPGGLVVAGLMPLMGSLTSLNVMFNSLGPEGKAAIKEAVQGKEGFKLFVAGR